MTTPLHKPVRRKTQDPESFVQGDPIIVALEPGDMIAMRQAGRRTWYRNSINKVFWVLAKWHAMDEQRRAAEERRRKRELRSNGLA